MQLAVFGFPQKGTHKQSYLCSPPDTPCSKALSSLQKRNEPDASWKGNRTDTRGEKVEKKTYKRRVKVMGLLSVRKKRVRRDNSTA